VGYLTPQRRKRNVNALGRNKEDTGESRDGEEG